MTDFFFPFIFLPVEIVLQTISLPLNFSIVTQDPTRFFFITIFKTGVNSQPMTVIEHPQSTVLSIPGTSVISTIHGRMALAVANRLMNCTQRNKLNFRSHNKLF